MAGIFRLVCSNGLMVQSADFGSIRVHHSGGEDFQQRVIDATYQIVEEAPGRMAAIEEWKQIELSRPQQTAFAEAAMEIKPNASIRPAHLLTARREADYTDQEGRRDLWRTANVLQENLLQGGVQGRNERAAGSAPAPSRASARTCGSTGPSGRSPRRWPSWSDQDGGGVTAPVFPPNFSGDARLRGRSSQKFQQRLARPGRAGFWPVTEPSVGDEGSRPVRAFS